MRVAPYPDCGKRLKCIHFQRYMYDTYNKVKMIQQGEVYRRSLVYSSTQRIHAWCTVC